MTWLIAGLIIFFGVHLFTSFRAARDRLIARLGEGAYKGLYSLVAFAGFALIVTGAGRVEAVSLWTPPVWGRYAAIGGMPFALISLAAAFIPSNFKRVTAHPMLWGVTLWALVHLLANGDLAGLLLFGAFLLYGIYAMWSQNRRGAAPSQTRRPVLNDVALVAAGLIAYGLILRFHAQLFGAPVL